MTKRPFQPLRVLVADDHDDSRVLVQTFFSLLGLVIATAADGREALALAEQVRPQIVFLDIWMPGLSGVDVCSRLRTRDWAAHIPIYGMSADLMRLEQTADCFDQTLVKPIDLDKLADLVLERQQRLTRQGMRGLH